MSAATLTRLPGRQAWLAVLVPPLAWGTQLVAGYSIDEAGCGRPDASLWGEKVATVITIVVVTCGAATAAAGLAALSCWRTSDDSAPGLERFFAVVGLLGSPIFLFAIVLDGVAFVPLNGCAAG